MMLNDSRAAFPNRIRALVADSDERFLRLAGLMLSLLNFLVATCDSPAVAVKLLSGRLKDADVVFIDALRATTCGFDFRGIVETHLCIPVVYLFAFDYNISGDVAAALRRNVFAATYVIKKPLDAEELCRLWRIIQWSQVLLRRGRRTLSWLEWPRGNQALPAGVEALLASSSTAFEHQGEEERVVREGRGRRRKLADSHDGAGSSSSYSRGRRRVAVGGRPTDQNVTQGHEGHDDDDVVPSHQQAGQQNRRGLQAVGVQNQQPVRSLCMQPVPQMLNLPRNNPMISADAAGPSSSNVAPWARASNTSAPALLPLPVYHSQARANLLIHQQLAQQNRRGVLQAMGVQNQQHGQSVFVQPIHQTLNVPHINPMIFVDTAGPSNTNATTFAGAISTQTLLPTYQAPAHASQAPVPRLPPQVYQQQQPMAGLDNFPRSQGNWMGRRCETGPIMHSFQQPPAADPFRHMASGDTTFGASPAGASEAGAHRDTSMAHLQSPSVGAQQEADSFNDVFQAMMEMNDTFPRSYNANYSANGLLDPATNELAPMVGTGNCSNYNAGSSSMVTGVNGGNSASFMAPQDLMVPTGNQVELGAPDIYGSPVESPGSSAMFNENGEMAALLPSDQYDDNTMLYLDALWDFDDDVPVHPEGQQAAATDDIANTTHATTSKSNGGESGSLGPNGNMGAADDGLELLEEHLKDDNASDFLHPQDKNNGHQ